MIKKWSIYKIENPKGKIYIGISSNFKKRLNYYKNNELSRQKRLFASFNKYGFENHKISIIEEFESNINYAFGKEIFWIRAYMCNYCKWPEINGLNLTDGGQGSIGYKASEELKKKLSDIHKRNPSKGFLGKKHSQETKDKINKAKGLKNPIVLKIKPTKEETREKQSLAKKGKPPPNKGKPMPLHQKEILIKINTGRPSWNKGKKFEGTNEERQRKFGAHNIGNKYNKGRKHPQSFIDAAIERQNKPIIQFSLTGYFIKEFKSIKEAHLELKMSATTIGNILNGKTEVPKKFIFKYKQQ